MENIRIYDSRLKKKVQFEPIKAGKVSFYLCGPTVYDLAHLGHGRSAVAFDLIRRYFEYRGFDVNFVSNYTDIDDKMINRAKEEGVTVPELADRVIPEYEEDYDALGIKRASEAPRATSYIDEMISIIEKLEKGGFAYVLDDGVYFDVEKYSDYGALSGQKLEELKMGARVDVNDSKRNPYDFVLWKFKKDDEPFWKSPWGEGRPGWHIECSAMSGKLLGETFDIHGGGRDLLFPHHECEVAQSVCANGAETFAKYWLHNGFINVDDEKMSKSLGNFFTLRDVFKKYDPKVVRFMFLQTHYRNPINFSDKLLEQAKAGLERLRDFVRKISTVDGDGSFDVSACVATAHESFTSSMDEDFDSSGAFGAVFELVKKVNSAGFENVSSTDGSAVLDFLKSVDEVLGVIFVDEGSIDDEVEDLISEREEARKNKDFEASDRIRDELKVRGIEIDDTPNGTIWKKV